MWSCETTVIDRLEQLDFIYSPQNIPLLNLIATISLSRDHRHSDLLLELSPLYTLHHYSTRSPARIELASELQLIYILAPSSKLLRSRTFTLRYKQTCQAHEKHEQRKDLHDSVNPRRGVIVRGVTFDHGCEEDLGDHGAELAEASGNAVAS